MNLLGLAKIHVELSSICRKGCHICGRRDRDKKLIKKGINPKLQYGHMDLEIIKKIASDIPINSGLTIATHNNGESMESHYYGEAVKLFKSKGCFVYTVTNGQRLIDKYNEIVDNVDALSISIFEGDVEREKQFEIITKFLSRKGNKLPYTTLRLIGNVDPKLYEQFGNLIIKRLLHKPEGSFGYKTGIKGNIKMPTIPEHGSCLDFLNTLAIDRLGDVFCCVRFNPNKELLLGNIMNNTLIEIWNCKKRIWMKEKHIHGKRSEIEFCSKKCQFYGVPTGE